MGVILIATIVLLIASGCGAVDEGERSSSMQATEMERLHPAPPIEALDQPVPDDSVIEFDPDQDIEKIDEGPVFSFCFEIGPTGETTKKSDTDCESPQQRARIEREEREFREHVAPAPGSTLA